MSQIKKDSFFHRWSLYSIITVLAVSVLVLAGWRFDIIYLRRPFPHLVSMNPLTALLFATTSVSFLIRVVKRKPGAVMLGGYCLAWAVIGISVLKLLSILGLFNLPVDQFFFTDKVNADIVNQQPNSMAPNTAICFLLAGLSILLLNYKTPTGRMPSQYFALAITLIGLLSILGYIYGVNVFYGIMNYIPMAVHSALCFSAFSAAVFLQNPRDGFMRGLTSAYTGSTVAKILIPVSVFVPSVLGLIRVHAERRGIVSFEFGTAMLVMSIIVVFLIVIWYVTLLLNKKDKLRIIAEKDLEASRKQLEHLNEDLESKIELKTIEIRETFERVSDVFYALDEDEKFTFVNKRAVSVMGKQPGELLGRRIWDIFPRENVSASFLDAYDRAKKTQEYQSTDSFSRLAERWFSTHIYPSVGGISLFLRDVTDSKKALDAAERERVMNASIIQSLPGIFYFFDNDGKFLGWNKNFEMVSGYSAEEISQMTPPLFFPEDERDYIQGRIGKAFVEGYADAEANFLTKDGKKIYHYFTGVQLDFEGKTCLIGVGIDISQQKRIEAELRLSEQKYRLLFEWNPMPMWMLSLTSYKFIAVNNAAVTHYGYSKEEFLSMDIKNLRPKEEVQRLEQAITQQFQQVTGTGVWTHRKKNGELIFVEIITHDIIYEDRAVRLILANDITEKLAAEKELEQSNKTLRELSAHLQDVREEERKRIAREIHDELGQQLTVIKMDVSWIRKRTDPSNGIVLDKIKELTGILDETVNTVRKISSRLRPSLLDDLGLVAAMEWYINDFKQRTGMDIQFNLPAEEIKLPESLNTCLFRILQESLTNVARHADASLVNVSLKEDDAGIVLTVFDNGKGYNDELATGKKTLGITGMKERAAMAGGKYTIRGKPGQGTLVSIEVPSVHYLSTKNELI